MEKDLGFCVVVLRWDSADQLYDSTRFTGWHTAYRDAAPQNQGYAVSAAAEFEYFLFDETPQSIRDKDYRQLKPMTPGSFDYSDDSLPINILRGSQFDVTLPRGMPCARLVEARNEE